MARGSSVNVIKNFVKREKSDGEITRRYQVGDDGTSFEVKIQTKLSVSQKAAFIHKVLEGAFTRDGEYAPEYVLPAFRAAVLMVCTNITPIKIKNENGEPDYLDLDAMSELYDALKFGEDKSDGFRELQENMDALCHEAILWKQRKILYSGLDSLSIAAHAVTELAAALKSNVDGVDMKSLSETAAEIANRAEIFNEENILTALDKIHNRVS